MNRELYEKAFEDAIVATLVGEEATAGVEAPRTGYGSSIPGGYQQRSGKPADKDYDRDLALIPVDVLDFLAITQPEEWKKYRKHHGEQDARPRLLRRLAREADRRGTLSVLREGFKDTGCKFKMAFFRPHSGLNEELRRRYQQNIFTVVRQLFYKEGSNDSVDVVLFLNGLPLFTAELKNLFTGQRVLDAVAQYRRDRDPRERLFAFGRCLAHFAVDPEQVQVTTHLQGPKTRFLPFNQGYDRGAGNPPVAPTRQGYRTDYLWRQVWAKDSVLNLVQHFIHRVQKDADTRPGRNGAQIQLFPRYHQLHAVRDLVADARRNGPGSYYLVQHSAGSGKSFTIAWLAHWLSVLHDDEDRRVFDSIVVITDRRVLDRQLQETIRQFEQTLGVVENIDTTSKQLKEALEEGKTIIVTTLQKFPVILDEVKELEGRRFAVIVDEAHSSQTGESTKALKSVLSVENLDEAEEAEAGEPEDTQDRIEQSMRSRQRLDNASFFAFTATPKPKTLELFGRQRPEDGKFEPHSLYSMRQAIEEGFILDVLENYTTYETYWKLQKRVEDDPRYERSTARALLKRYVELEGHAIRAKVEIMVDHFHRQVQHRIEGKAKAMVVTRSRLHCVRTFLALRKALEEEGLPYEALVAFSGTVEDGDEKYTESQLNGLPESQTKAAFERPQVRFLVVADKFQTGFDQPLLHTMYVDKKLGGVAAVQTLSRLNRTHPDKEETMVLDFANEAEAIRMAFKPFYETTLLSEETDPNLLYEKEQELLDVGVFTREEVDAFAELFFGNAPQADLYQNLEPIKARIEDQMDDGEILELRSALRKYQRLYSFLSQVITFVDADLEKLYVFARLLRRHLKTPERELPREIQEKVDMDSLRIQRTFQGKVELESGPGTLDPMTAGRTLPPQPEELEPLSKIIEELNERFGTKLRPEDRITAERLLDQMMEKEALRLSIQNNPEENARLAFETVFMESFQSLVETNFQFFRRVSDNPDFGQALKDRLFEEIRRRLANGDLQEKDVVGEIADGETRKREFKSTLRRNLHTDKNDDRITHAVLKTVAAFQNTEGGVLYIGVADDGTLVGLGPDGFANPDKFLLHLNNMVKSALGAPAAARLKMKIWTLGEHDICRVECPPSPRPVFVRHGNEETFYVRTGPSTEALSPSEMHQYVGERFSD